VQISYAVIRSALSTALKAGLVNRNVAKLCEVPIKRGGSSSIVPLSLDEARRFLAAVNGHRLHALYSVALALGLRRGEALGLEWSAVDLAAGAIAVTQTIKRVQGKGLLMALEREFAGDAWRERGLVFTSTIGTPMEPRNLVRHFHATLKSLGNERKRFHDLRHSCASWMISDGATLHEVKEILGHSQIALTANLYGHAFMVAKREVISRIDTTLNPASPSLAPLKAIN
jgi:integrase